LPGLIVMTDGIEIWRGGVNTWECDGMGPMKVPFYVPWACRTPSPPMPVRP